jgi:putative DNA methylase
MAAGHGGNRPAADRGVAAHRSAGYREPAGTDAHDAVPGAQPPTCLVGAASAGGQPGGGSGLGAAGRAAVLASVLPAGADRAKFMHALGIHGDPMAAKLRIAAADRKGERLGKDAYGYSRAFGWSPNDDDRAWMAAHGMSDDVVVLDPTAGGGSIPFEAARLGASVLSNDLNPVAALIEKATVEYPIKHGAALRPAFDILGREFTQRVRERLQGEFPPEPEPDCRPDGYLWARTIHCPHCEGLVPLSPNWRLAPDGTGVRVVPRLGAGPGDPARRCGFQIVREAAQHSPGTVSDGDGLCPFPDCGRPIAGGSIKAQAQAGDMGEQLFAVVLKRRVETRTKAGKPGRDKWERGYRAPRPEDDNSAEIAVRLAERMEEWEALDLVPSEDIGDVSNYDRGHRMYGIRRWSEFFSPRHLLCHRECVALFRDMLAERAAVASLSVLDQAAFIYLALAIDTMINYGSRACRWDIVTERVRSVFDRHGFAFLWSYGEMACLVNGLGFDWAMEKTASCISELVQLSVTGAKPRVGLRFRRADRDSV